MCWDDIHSAAYKHKLQECAQVGGKGAMGQGPRPPLELLSTRKRQTSTRSTKHFTKHLCRNFNPAFQEDWLYNDAFARNPRGPSSGSSFSGKLKTLRR